VTFSNEALVQAARLSARYVTDRHLPDKAIDLMDEAAAKLRVALYSMPDDLKALKSDLDHMTAEEEQAGIERDYERAAKKKRNGSDWKPSLRKSVTSGNRNTSWMKWWMSTTLPTWLRSGRESRSPR